MKKYTFVFGSNESGIHGAGAAKTAVNLYGAVMGVGFGPQGDSFAIPTKSWDIAGTLTLETIQHYVDAFKRYAANHVDQKFMVTRIGCGLAGLQDKDIAPMFAGSSSNCHFDEKWKEFLPNTTFWGSF